ncbi:MAG TPA: serine/threonine-protein kinase [Gemmatimonadaceae bacterium]|nr:serine/threonine-protein kinase [Gemmatimonadaceae bacterium]
MADATRPDIGKYHIIELVGEGAMGVVYRANDSVLDRTVAIKVMNESIARQEDLRKRFLHEAQAAASLQHPNVVSIYDLGEVDGHMFIAMEFVDGVDLEKLLELGQPLSLQAKLDIIIDVLTGLTFAHKRGIVHRDIKPANIRVTEDGRAKIMDFGVAHLASSSMTSTGSFLGTPSYMAPEQITEGKTTPQTDLFAVGGVLYQLLTQMKPFEAPTLQNLFFRIITEKPKPVSELMPGLPPALDRIVAKAMAKEPSDRYATALEMANELSAVRAKLSGPAYPESVSLTASVSGALEMARKKQSRTRSLAYAVGGAVAAIVLLVGWSLIAKARALQNAVAEQSAPPASFAPAQTTTTPPANLTENHGGGATAPTTSTGVGSPPAAPAPTPQKSAVAKESPATKTVRTVTPPKTPPKTTISRTPQQNVASRSSGPVTTAAPSTTLQTTAQAPLQNPVVQQQLPTLPPVVQHPVETKQQDVAPPPAPPSPATRDDIAPIVEAYARAIESRDIGAIRRVYPGLTSTQQQRWETFFQSARSINVTLRIASFDGSPTGAEARLAGSYEFVNADGRTERQPDTITASFRKEGGNWRLVAVH